MSTSGVEWPWQYNFPPFFTLQPNLETRTKQLNAWKVLVLDYCRTNRICSIDVRDIAALPVFHNSTINRTLDSNAVVALFNNLSTSGNATPLDKERNSWEIYWYTLDEFFNMIYSYVLNNNLLNSVLTFFELTEGDDVQNEAFYKLSEEVLLKVLQVGEQSGKCEVILFDDNKGVKFF